MLNKFKFICCTLFIFTATTSPFQAQAANNLGSKLLIGYWHNFDNGTGIIKLRDVSPKWDVINVSFGKLVVIVLLLNFLLCMVQMQNSNQIFLI